MEVVYTANGMELTLEDAMASGGEGSVHKIMGYPNKIVKVYHKKNEAQKREPKINAMIEIANDYTFRNSAVLDRIAWPQSPIYDKNNEFIGFGMNSIPGKIELDDVYEYPPKANANISIKDKVKCLISLCDVIDSLHKTGNQFGDFNPQNIKIYDDFSVGFVDADSYNVHKNGETYRCIVCARGYAAPEVVRKAKGKTYEKCLEEPFTVESDYFGLAIHIFRMLNNGCHPYTCEEHVSGQGSVTAAKPLDKRVEHGETPFFTAVPNAKQPDWALSADCFPTYIRRLFERAFVEGHNNPSARPTAQEWKNALIQFDKELVPCKSIRAHYYWNGISSCPYCKTDEVVRNKRASFLNNKPFNLNYQQTYHQAPVNSQATYNQVPVNNTLNRMYANAGIMNVNNSNTSYGMGTATTEEDRKKYVIMYVVTVLLSFLGSLFIASAIYNSCGAENLDFLVQLGIIGGMIAGIVGTCMYNNKHSSYQNGGRTTIGDYFSALLYSVLYTVGFILALAAIVVVIEIVLFILQAVFTIVLVVAIIAGLCSSS